jgi:hypothetical protein
MIAKERDGCVGQLELLAFEAWALAASELQRLSSWRIGPSPPFPKVKTSLLGLSEAFCQVAKE